MGACCSKRSKVPKDKADGTDGMDTKGKKVDEEVAEKTVVMEDREQVEVSMTTDPDLETAEDNETPAGEISDDQANLQASSEKQPVTEGPKETENLIKEENEGTDMKIVKSEQESAKEEKKVSFPGPLSDKEGKKDAKSEAPEFKQLQSVANFTTSSFLVPDPKEKALCDLEIDDAKSEEDKKRITSGEMFKKYSFGFFGKAKMKFIVVSDNKLYWVESKKVAITKKVRTYMYLKEIREIRLGKNTDVFKKKGKVAKPDLCFSMVGTVQNGKERTLDLEASSKGQLESWVRGILYMQHLMLQE